MFRCCAEFLFHFFPDFYIISHGLSEAPRNIANQHSFDKLLTHLDGLHNCQSHFVIQHTAQIHISHYIFCMTLSGVTPIEDSITLQQMYMC